MQYVHLHGPIHNHGNYILPVEIYWNLLEKVIWIVLKVMCQQIPIFRSCQSGQHNTKKRMKELGIKLYKHLGISKGDREAINASWKLNFKLFGAPIVIYLCMHETLSEWSMFDLGSLSQSIMLAAQEYGIDSAPAVNLVAYSKIIRKAIEIPDELRIVIGIALGYKDNDSPQNTFISSRRPLDEVVHLNGI